MNTKRQQDIWIEIKKKNGRATQILLCKKKREQEATLLRMFDCYTEVTVPTQTKEFRIVEIGPYCFARTVNLPQEWEAEEGIATLEELERFTATNHLHEIGGDYAEKITLPETVEQIGNCAFYNCRELKQICLGAKVRETGSDVFMNCRKLKKLVFHCTPESSTGLKEILGRIAADIVVQFQREEQVLAKILYPEYFETYDEIAPAHIFGRNIVGEGFRARQCFRNGCIDFTSYDGIFSQICVDETAGTASTMAFYRLQYPIGLSREAKDRYGKYLKNHSMELAGKQIKQQNLENLKFLCENHYVTEIHIDKLIDSASEQGWPEGVASLMVWKNAFYEKKGAERYFFDDWE